MKWKLNALTFFADKIFPILKSNLEGSTALSGVAFAPPFPPSEIQEITKKCYKYWLVTFILVGTVLQQLQSRLVSKLKTVLFLHRVTVDCVVIIQVKVQWYP